MVFWLAEDTYLMNKMEPLDGSCWNSNQHDHRDKKLQYCGISSQPNRCLHLVYSGPEDPAVDPSSGGAVQLKSNKKSRAARASPAKIPPFGSGILAQWGPGGAFGPDRGGPLSSQDAASRRREAPATPECDGNNNIVILAANQTAQTVPPLPQTTPQKPMAAAAVPGPQHKHHHGRQH
jgi:hypothetical protein